MLRLFVGIEFPPELKLRLSLLAVGMPGAKWVDAGNLHINWGPMWRADLMPYGGLKESGFGKEGPKYAVQEMTELKTVVIHSRP